MEDATGNATGFTNGASQTNEYTYDHNGNLTKDLNKGITNISYNCLNLPSVVTFTDGSTVSYTYSAEGKKLRTVHVTNGATTTTDYCGNVIYENGTAKLLLTEAGYVDLTDNSHHFYIKDHLGNNRVVADANGAVGESNQYYPFGLTYANVGSNLQPYKYNGKELDTKVGLNWYDYGARHYDAVLGRWFVVDPLVEKMYGWSPYGYCLNNPIMYIDPNGKREWPVNETYKGYGRKHSNNFGEQRGNRVHQGVDINHTGGGNTDKGASIIATHDGIITRIARFDNGDKNAGGNRIVITSADGTVSTSYMHLEQIGDFQVGMNVSEGQQIGTMGGSGKGRTDAYSSHLHYEIRFNGEIINPANGAESLIDPQQIISPIDGGTLQQIEITAPRINEQRNRLTNLINDDVKMKIINL